MKYFYKKISNILKIDHIRIFKLFEITQYALISFFLSLFIGDKINNLIGEIDTNSPTYKIVFLEMIPIIFILTISTYYIRKMSTLLPFIFIPIIDYFNLSYIPSKKDEALLGTAFGMGYIFMTTQSNLSSRIHEINLRY